MTRIWTYTGEAARLRPAAEMALSFLEYLEAVGRMRGWPLPAEIDDVYEALRSALDRDATRHPVKVTP